MWDWLSQRDFMPHGHCYLWRADILWMHVISDAVIALAYFSIPLTLMYFLRRRADVPFRGMIAMFAAFIVLCGTTHIVGIVTIWNPVYVADGALKAVTAAASLATAAMMVPFIPVALSMRSPSELEALNARLAEELELRNRSERGLQESLAALAVANRSLEEAESKLAAANADLERRVQLRTAQLQASNSDLEGFSYSVSHDLRAPLRAIDNFAAFLHAGHAAQLDEEGKRLLSKIRAGSARMSELIEGILAFSRAGKQELSVAPIDMNALARSAFEEAAERTGGHAVLELDNLAPASGDPMMLRLVFNNLLANALKFSAGRESPVVRVSCSVVDGGVVYSVNDNGVGFDPTYGHKLFGVFQRLHPLRKFEGTGVGLAIVKRIVEKHGGRVWAEGAPDQGATISFLLPRYLATPSNTEAGHD